MPPEPKEPVTSWETVNGAEVEFGRTYTRVGADHSTLRVTENLTPIPGWHDVIVHGTPEGLFEIAVKTAPNKPFEFRLTNVNHVIEAVANNPHYRGEPIRLVSCHSGLPNNTAQLFADGSGRSVIGSMFRIGFPVDFSKSTASSPILKHPSQGLEPRVDEHGSPLPSFRLSPGSEEFVLFRPRSGSEPIDAMKAIPSLDPIDATRAALAVREAVHGSESTAKVVLGAGSAPAVMDETPMYVQPRLTNGQAMRVAAIGGLGTALGNAGASMVTGWVTDRLMNSYLKQHQTEIETWV